ncbi:class A beta-lactamase-related serine hydrolase, partial [Escherichia coli]|nr:class A beta-lactamase-related serine hydrolase [Escherichia coli]
MTWTNWDEALWDDNGGLGGTALLPGSAEPETEFMLPYPGSLLKLLVAFGVLRLVDQGAISLDDVYDYAPQGPSTDCVGASSQPIGDFFSQMITYSDNYATCALIKLLHDEDAVDPLNAEFQALGLG